MFSVFIHPALIKVEESSGVSEARFAARNMARALDFDEAGAERAAIVATEICTNLLKHAGGGSLCLAPNRERAIELLGLDRGPGMSNLRQCLADGYSTTGTPGTGLGAISRLSAFSEAYSQPGRGTAIFSIVVGKAGAKQPAPNISGVQANKPGQEVCGDAWGWKPARIGNTVVVADGLGHGPDAAAAARCAMEIFHKHSDASPRDILESIHLGLKHTRGAAVSVASMDEDRRIVAFAGLGNVSGYVCETGQPRRQFVSMNGTAGLEARTSFREFSYPWPRGSAVVLHSDGLTSHWGLDDYPALISRGPALLAGVLFRDFSRGTDDATVVAAV